MDGRRINGAHALGRWFAAALSYLTLFIGFLMAAVTDSKRALHDYVAGAQVVDAWAYTSFPERQKRGLSGCLVAFLVAMLMVPILAILAAIAISQYQGRLPGLSSDSTPSPSSKSWAKSPTQKAMEAWSACSRTRSVSWAPRARAASMHRSRPGLSKRWKSCSAARV